MGFVCICHLISMMSINVIHAKIGFVLQSDIDILFIFSILKKVEFLLLHFITKSM